MMYRASLLLVAASTGLLLAPAALVAQTPTATYRVTFEATWSAATHPVDHPPGAHFSPLIGTAHDDAVHFWRSGELASDGIERMAEAGMSSPLDAEVAAAITAGHARKFLQAPGFRSPGMVTMDFTVDVEMPRVTLVSMLAPSPDWFTGVDSLPLMANGDWVAGRQVVVYPWDAGTDSGLTYAADNQDTRPAEPISVITYGPLGNGVPVGTFTFTRLDAPPPAPLTLRDGRFEIDVAWQTLAGLQGFGHPQELTGDTGYFWFFRSENIELVVKVLDACQPFDRFWVFVGGLTSVEVVLTVRDTETNAERVYRNPLATAFRPIQDTNAFATCP